MKNVKKEKIRIYNTDASYKDWDRHALGQNIKATVLEGHEDDIVGMILLQRDYGKKINRWTKSHGIDRKISNPPFKSDGWKVLKERVLNKS